MSLPQGRIRQALYYGLPMLFCLAVHWMVLKTWFSSDDFAWLGLRLQVHSPSDLIDVLFRPQAEGTVRTLSERLFFLVFSTLFGLESPPFRIWAFLTQFANVVLLIQITRRLTGSELAGFVAPILWCANAGFALAIGWSAAYNQIACAFFMLLAFYLLLRYVDTGQRKYWIWQWVVFLLGFLVLELNVVYPALAAGYALCCA
ncbi:MAG TPA: glycosyltransferase family 39 protein, partial [Bryobacteraceae bacterium]|nr:glycosyltransferase family 39 protein [Bryobacteraceae bacterium]